MINLASGHIVFAFEVSGQTRALFLFNDLLMPTTQYLKISGILLFLKERVLFARLTYPAPTRGKLIG
jgi:hypothetical protein